MIMILIIKFKGVLIMFNARLFARLSRGAYIFTIFLSIYSLFYVTVSYLFNENEHKHEKGFKIEDHAFAILIGLFAGFIQACEDNYLEGPKIEASIISKYSKNNNFSDEDIEVSINIEDEEDEISRNWKSNLCEALYIPLSIILVITQNIFTGLAGKAWIHALEGEHPIRALENLDGPEIILISIYSVLVDVPFNLATSGIGVAEEIKKWLTGSPNDSLLNSLLKVLANPVGIAWVKYVGAFSHVMEHMINLSLCIPPQLILKLNKNKTVFAASLTGCITFGLILMIFNGIQTFLFESKIAENKLKEIKQNGEKTPLLLWRKPNKKEEKIILSPFLYGLIKIGLHLNLFVHGADETLPPMILLRHLLNKHGARYLKLPLTATLAPIQCIPNMFGNLHSELYESLKSFEIKKGGDEENQFGSRKRFNIN